MTLIHEAIALLAIWTVNIIERTGELGVFFLMLVESANIPIPSEVTMPFAGFAASRGELVFWVVVVAGAFGNLVGSLISYWIGYVGGRPFLERYGKYIFVHTSDLERGDRAFAKYGSAIAFWSRLLPIVRTFVSLPAGINKSPVWRFSTYTFAGSFIWSWFLAWIGFWLGENWELARPVFEKSSVLIAGFIVLGAVIYIWSHVKDKNPES